MARGRRNNNGKFSNKREAARSSSPSDHSRDSKAIRLDVEILLSTFDLKPKMDTNEYRLIRLPNKMTILLIQEQQNAHYTPNFHHMTPNRLGLWDFTPPMGSLFPVPEFDSIGLPCRVRSQRTMKPFTRNRITGGLLSSPAEEENFLLHVNDELPILSCCGDGPSGGIENDARRQKEVIPEEMAFALCVNVGASNDPSSHYGLAHFCEHMVHYGSKKLQKEDAYFKFINSKGSGANAFTQNMTTTYHGSFNINHVEEGLEIFSNLMKEPLFKEDVVKREVHAVDNEFNLKRFKDFMSQFHIMLRKCTKENSPLDTFPCGDLSTLKSKEGGDIKGLLQKLKEFHSAHYVGSAMTMAIQSTLSLDEMQRYVEKHFSGIPQNPAKVLRHQMKIPECHKNPYDSNYFRKYVIVDGKQSHRQLTITWALEPEAWKNYKNKPMEYLGVLIGGEWVGGLAHELRSSGLISEFSASCPNCEMSRNEYTTLFIIEMTLAGRKDNKKTLFKEIDEILEKTFDYFESLKSLSPAERKKLWDELSKSDNTYVNHSGVGFASDFTVQCARFLQTIPEKDILSVNFCHENDYNDELILRCLNQLNPSSLNVMLIQPDCSKTNFPELGNYNTERYTGTRYWEKPFSSSALRNLNKSTLSVGDNPYSSIFNGNSSSITRPLDEPIKEGTVVANSPKYQIVHQGTSHKNVFKAVCRASIVSAAVQADRDGYYKLRLLRETFTRAMLPKICDMQHAGLGLNFETRDLLHIQIMGFAASIFGTQSTISAFDVIMEDLLEKVTISEVNFNVVKELLENEIIDNLRSPNYLSSKLLQEFLIVDIPSFRNDLNVLKAITYEEFQQFFKLFRKSSFVAIYVEGKASISECQAAASTLERLCYSAESGNWRKSLLSKQHRIFLPMDERCIRLRNPECVETNSCITNIYQFSLGQPNLKPIIEFLSIYMGQPCFQVLRTEKQLGYRLGLSDATGILRTPGIIVDVVFPSAKHLMSTVNKEIDNLFVKVYHEYLGEMNECEFQKQRKLWNLPSFPKLTLAEVKTFFKDTFMAHLSGDRSRGDNCDKVWNSGGDVMKIGKLSIQVCGGEGNDRDSIRCKWRNDNSNIQFACDEDQTASRVPYFIENPPQFRQGLL